MDSYLEKWCCLIIFLDEERNDQLEILHHTLDVVANFTFRKYIYSKAAFQLPVGLDPSIELFTITSDDHSTQRKQDLIRPSLMVFERSSFLKTIRCNWKQSICWKDSIV